MTSLSESARSSGAAAARPDAPLDPTVDATVDAGNDVLSRFHPVVAAWFRATFGHPTEPQLRGWPRIADREHTLIAAPTGSGKTLAAFLACLDRLIRQGLAEGLPERTQIVYVSPLKALGNDIHRNLEVPLAELGEAFTAAGLELPPIRTAVRSGDTPASERQKMARRPPHILITTPESLYILLTSERGRANLAEVETVIVDEIHAMAGDKRGAHLALTLERLERLVAGNGGATPVRVGLSATQKPIELIARMLVGTRHELPHIVDGGHARTLDVAIEITDDELGAVASREQMGRVYDRIAELVAEHQTTLVFVNTRRLVERVSHALEERLGEDQVVAHHGSLSRKIRFAAEQKLKHGQVRCAVATASLELGIDVGCVDLVVQLGSPRCIATLLQRIGRSGHSLGATPKGRLFALTRDQLVECAALVRAVQARALDAIEPAPAALDILAQQIVAAAASAEIGEDELFELVRGAYHYGELDRAEFEQVLVMLSEGVSDRRGRIGTHIHWDRVNGRIKAKRGARLAAITSGGAIPDNANYQVTLMPDEARIGEVDEDFALDSMAGDVFLLGNQPWRILRVETGRVLVEDATGMSPTVPHWFGEAPGRTFELSEEVGALRAHIEHMHAGGADEAEMAAWVANEACLSEEAGAQLVAYLLAARAALGTLPTTRRIIAERFFDEGGGMQLVIHSPLGARINRAWGLALRKRFCRSFNFELQAAATDDGIVISLGQPHSFPLESVFAFLTEGTVEDILVQAFLDQPMFEIRWRWNATRSLAVLRRAGGKKIAPHILRMRANDLLSVVFPQQQACLETIVGDREVPDHPLVKETVRDCLTEAMDIERLRALIAGIEAGEIEVLGRDTVTPSPLSHELINANPYAFLDDAGLEDRRTRAVSLRRSLPAQGDATALDPAAIAQAEGEARPVVRDIDELHDALLALYLVPAALGRGLGARAGTVSAAEGDGGHLADELFERLVSDGRATRLVHRVGEREHVAWVAAERLPLARAVLPEARPLPALPALPFTVEVPEPEAVHIKIIGAHLDHSGPRTGRALAAALGLAEDQVLAALFALENDGAILRGSFSPGAPAADASTDDLDIEWCNRRILARIHRLTISRLRSEVEPVSAAALMRFLFRWQRVTHDNRLAGSEGLHVIIEQLQGFETAAGAWEREVLSARLHDYDPTWLDSLCLSGQVAWCRLSPRRAGAGATAGSNEVAGEAGATAAATTAAATTDATGADEHDGDDAAATDERPGSAEGKAGGRVMPTRAAPLALLLRRDIDWLRAPAAKHHALGDPGAGGARADDGRADDDLGVSALVAGLGDSARAVHAHLRASGASFLAEIAQGTGLAPDQVEDGLWALAQAGLATADGFAGLRVLVDRERGESRSLFDAMGQPANSQRVAPRASSWQNAIRKARRRERRRPVHAVRSLPAAAGRWSLLGPPDPAAGDVEASARQLLGRYGVVFRDLLVRESNLPPWRELLGCLRRLEARGEIRGGRFVRGFVGEQFALPEVVDGLRTMRAAPAVDELVRIPATDPLNLVGITSGGAKVPAVMGNAVLYRNGVPIASLEAGQVVTRAELDEGARVDEDLLYHPPPRRPQPAPRPSPQMGLPLSLPAS
ncbi:DEAD/DEAH box helicase [Haliangium sp.]|uniref:DEAD/DEAH box helicase n=1 Tax=Haliangium sp. TaxID=2663208 RepID=UPI003D09C785